MGVHLVEGGCNLNLVFRSVPESKCFALSSSDYLSDSIAFPIFQPLLQYLITAEVKVPEVRRHSFEILLAINPDRAQG